MKSLCSLYTFLFLLSAHATQIRIIHLSKNTQQAELVRSIFVKRYSVPKGLIEIRESAECRSLDQRFFELCINKKGELIEISSQNISNKIKSLKVFKPEV